MQDILLYYQQITPTTWIYLSSLLTISLYFKFNRVWSLRNFDLLALICFAPGLVLVDSGKKLARADIELIGYIWIFAVIGVFCLRMLLDPMMVRRPLLEPNMTLGGMTFLAASLLVFLIAKILTVGPDELGDKNLAKPASPAPAIVAKADITDLGTAADLAKSNLPEENKRPSAPPVSSAVPPTAAVESPPQQPLEKPAASSDVAAVKIPPKNDLPSQTEKSTQDIANPVGANAQGADALVTADPLAIAKSEADPYEQAKNSISEEAKLSQSGPGFWLFRVIPDIATPIFTDQSENASKSVQQQSEARNIAAARTLSIFGLLAVVAGIVVIGYQHFGNLTTGIAAALLYMLLPYSAFYILFVKHILPAAILTWAIVVYRRPLLAGLMLGMASGMVYYPIFLLPLWVSFYWQRGLWRFVGGVLASMALLMLITAFYASGVDDFSSKIRLMLGFIFPTEQPEGFWGVIELKYRVYRITILAAHIALCGSFAIWPAQKNLGTLLSCSAAVMLSTQFWAAFGGAVSMAWFLPLLLLTIFRPNLEDRIALSVLGEGKWLTRRSVPGILSQAA
ncbi:MAG: hypothetical protein SFX18_19715 [Pirellulales bacterium]|nr:hypothetical protein [Pirellulales bacterium]